MKKKYLLFAAKGDGIVRYKGAYADVEDVGFEVDGLLLEGYVSCLCYDELTARVVLFRTVEDEEEEEDED